MLAKIALWNKLWLMHINEILNGNQGVIAVVIAALGLLGFFIKKAFFDPEESPHTQSNNQSNTQSVEVNIINNQKNTHETTTPNSVLPDARKLKVSTNILFIDNEKFKKIENLKKQGWKISHIKNVVSIDDEPIRNADIIFVDYKGVGSKEDDEGIGLLTALRAHYGKAKWLIFYSAHRLDLGVFDKGADAYLSKNSSPYEIEQKIIHGASKLGK